MCLIFLLIVSFNRKVIKSHLFHLNKGMLGVALRSEELRGKAKGLYVDYSKTMNVDINSPEFKEYVEMKHMSEKQIDQKLKDIEDEANRIIAAQEKEVEVDEDS